MGAESNALNAFILQDYSEFFAICTGYFWFYSLRDLAYGVSTNNMPICASQRVAVSASGEPVTTTVITQSAKGSNPKGDAMK